MVSKTRPPDYIFVGDSTSVNLMQLALKAAMFSEITYSDSCFAVQGHRVWY